jgi:hypothetical protein
MLNVISRREEFMDTVAGTLTLVMSGPETSETLRVLEVVDYGELPIRGEAAIMTIDLASQEWTRDWSEGRRKGKVAELDEAFMEQWMRQVGADLDGEKLSHAARSLGYSVREFSAGRVPHDPYREPWDSIGGGANPDHQENARLGRRVGLDFLCILIWIAGIALLVRGRRWGLHEMPSAVKGRRSLTKSEG